MGSDSVTGDQVRDAVDKRTEVLTALSEEPRHKPALVDALDVSRSTVDRAIAELTDAGLVEREGSTYQATVSGTLALQTYTDYADRTDSLATATDIVNAVSDAARLDPVLLTDAEIHIAEPHAPEGALERVVTELRQANTLRGFVQVIKTSYVSMLHEEVVDHGLDIEVIVEREASDSLASLTHGREMIVELFQSESFRVFETEAELPYALWVLEGDDHDVAGITVHDAGGIVGVVINDDEDAVEWCRSEYERVRAEAEQLPPNLLNG